MRCTDCTIPPSWSIRARASLVPARVRRVIRSLRRRLDFGGFLSRRDKVFCVGASKTGTTSMEALLLRLGYRVAPLAEAERLIHDWAQRDFRRCRVVGRWSYRVSASLASVLPTKWAEG
jgi:hypothetical protein